MYEVDRYQRAVDFFMAMGRELVSRVIDVIGDDDQKLDDPDEEKENKLFNKKPLNYGAHLGKYISKLPRKSIVLANQNDKLIFKKTKLRKNYDFSGSKFCRKYLAFDGANAKEMEILQKQMSKGDMRLAAENVYKNWDGAMVDGNLKG